MATESELRDRFHGPENGASPVGIDVDRVIRGARRRRRPRVVAIAAGSTLAVLALVVPVVAVSGLLGPRVAAVSGAAGSGAAAPDLRSQSGSGAADGTDPGQKRAPADRINLCTGAVAEVAPADDGLTVSVAFPAADAGAASIDGTATLTNTGPTRLTGSTAPSPAVTLSQGGIVLWHSNGAMIQSVATVDLGPGESMSLPVSLVPVRCGVQDDEDPGFREDLPALPAGDYEVSAALDFVQDQQVASGGGVIADAQNVLVTGPTSTLTLR